MGEDLGDWRLASSILDAIDGGLLPALLGLRLTGVQTAIRPEVFILQHKESHFYPILKVFLKYQILNSAFNVKLQ